MASPAAEHLVEHMRPAESDSKPAHKQVYAACEAAMVILPSEPVPKMQDERMEEPGSGDLGD